MADENRLEVAVIGAGFAGLAMAARLLERGEKRFAVFEAERRVGGTWLANTYPGCACDVESHLYSLSFEPNPDWSHRYARQPEILAYLEAMVKRRGITEYLRLGTTVEKLSWEGDGWRLETSGGAFTARHVVAATGPLRIPQWPNIPGLESFAGEVMHTARWRSEVPLDGTVAVIGTGASAIQVIPELARTASRLLVFQRTPPWVLPRGDAPYGERRRTLFRRIPCLRAFHRVVLDARNELLGTALYAAPALRWMAERRARAHLRRQVKDKSLRARLTPNYRIGCKRILLSDTYYPALAETHVELVDEPITGIVPGGVVAGGVERPADTLVFATGFDVTQFLFPLEVRGRDGRSLQEAWAGAPLAHLGITVPGFPNFYLLLGPNTGLGHTSVLLMAEAQIGYVLSLIEEVRSGRLERVEVEEDVARAYDQTIQRRLDRTVWNTGGCTSWYRGPDGRNATLWPGSTIEYRLRTRRPRAEDFKFSARQRSPATGHESSIKPHD